MYREIIEDLAKWKSSPRRKPLVLNGARQVGKTWILEEFGKTFPNGYIKVNFEKEPDYCQFFRNTKDPATILNTLSFATGKSITKDTLLFFDEIQECPEALNSLKYFSEDAPDQPVVCAGSLLGIALAKGFPVGKVSFLEMGPMSFPEFLLAIGKENLVSYMRTITVPNQIPDLFKNQLESMLKMYYIVGGMPEAVKAWSEESDIAEVMRIQEDILSSYEKDFGKHAPITDIPKMNYIWASIPSQLAKENKKFIYSAAKPGARAREFENSLQWLISAGDLVKVSRISKPGLPISAYEELDAFKIYMNDVGLLRSHSRLSSSVFLEENRIFTEFKGALTENYVLAGLQRILTDRIYYWADKNYEVDFIIQWNNTIIPVESKASENVRATSIKNYLEKYSDAPFAIRYSMRNLSFDGKILNIPLYLLSQTVPLIEGILEVKANA